MPPGACAGSSAGCTRRKPRCCGCVNHVKDFNEGTITVRFKGNGGRIDQGAGIVFNLEPNDLKSDHSSWSRWRALADHTAVFAEA